MGCYLSPLFNGSGDIGLAVEEGNTGQWKRLVPCCGDFGTDCVVLVVSLLGRLSFLDLDLFLLLLQLIVHCLKHRLKEVRSSVVGTAYKLVALLNV